MLFLKSVAIFLAAAIANPICCCVVTLSERSEPVETHQCCSGVSTAGEKGESGDSEDCPHSFEKDSQISQVPEVGDSYSKQAVALEFAAWKTADKILYASRIVVGIAGRDAPSPTGIGNWFSQAYCVYLL